MGKLACGYEAIGHLAEAEEIVRAIQQMVPVPTGAAIGQAPEAKQVARVKPKAKPAKRGKSRKGR